MRSTAPSTNTTSVPANKTQATVTQCSLSFLCEKHCTFNPHNLCPSQQDTTYSHTMFSLDTHYSTNPSHMLSLTKTHNAQFDKDTHTLTASKILAVAIFKVTGMMILFRLHYWIALSHLTHTLHSPAPHTQFHKVTQSNRSQLLVISCRNKPQCH